ncbi:MAG: PAS domain S-box protein [candidate division WOR-3 bacterium]
MMKTLDKTKFTSIILQKPQKGHFFMQREGVKIGDELMNENFHSLILDRLNIGYLVYQPIRDRHRNIIDAIIKDTCPALEALLGKTRSNLVGKELSKIKSKKNREILEFIKGLILHPRAEIIDNYFPRADKRIRFFVFPLDAKRFVLIFSIGAVTESEIAYELTNRWRVAVNALKEVVFTTDTQGRLVQWNKALEEQFKIPPKEKPVYCYEIIHGTKKRIASCPFFTTLKTKKRAECELALNNRYWHIVIDPIFADKKKIIGAIHILYDITEARKHEQVLKENEEKFRTLVENAQYGVVLLDKDKIVYANPFISRLLGYKETKAILGMPYYRFIYPKERGIIRERYQRRLKGLPVPALYETMLYNKEKKPVPVELQPRIITVGNKKYNLVVIYDLRERKRLEESLKISETRYRTIVENLAVGVYRSLPGGRGQFVEVNPQLVKILGYQSKDELLKVPVRDTYQRPQERINFIRELKTKDYLEAEIPLRRKDGSLIMARIIAHAIKDNQGKIQWIDGIVEDITERKKTEEALKYRGQILEIAADCAQELLKHPNWRELMPMMLAKIGQAAGVSRAYLWEKVVTPNGRVLTDQAYEWVAKGITPQQGSPLVHNFDFMRAGFGEWYQKLAQGEVITAIVRDLPKKMRDYLTAQDIKSLCLVPVCVKNEPWGLIGFDQCDYERAWTQIEIDALKTFAGLIGSAIYNEEINNQLKASEEKYRGLINNLSEGVFRTTPDGRFLEVNPALVSIHGAQSEEELLKINVNSLYENPQGREILLKTLKTQGAVRDWEVNQVRLDGKKITVAITARASFDKNGNIKWIEGIVRDITERKRAEEELRKAKEAAELANKAKSEFLHNMSHELRSPLTSIMGFTELALERETDPEKREYLETIQKSSDYLLHIINNILDLARIESGKMKLEMKPCNLKEIAQDIYDRFKVLAERKKLQFVLKVSPESPPQIVTDCIKVTQIVSNLVDNAFKFTEQGKVIVSFSLRRIAQRQGELEIYVKDTGIGIAPERQQMIFERFTQAEYYLSKKYGGAGLGLPLVKELVELFGGKITLESQLAKGSKFTVFLPVEIVET